MLVIMDGALPPLSLHVFMACYLITEETFNMSMTSVKYLAMHYTAEILFAVQGKFSFQYLFLMELRTIQLMVTRYFRQGKQHVGHV